MAALTADITKLYNHRYTTGNYAEQYADRSNLLVQSRIIAHAKQARDRKAHISGENNPPVTILDFGAGNGRLFYIMEHLANAGMHVNYVAADVSEGGLKVLHEKLVKAGFKGPRKVEFRENPGRGYAIAELTRGEPAYEDGQARGSITATLVHSSMRDSPDYLGKLLEARHIKPDITVSIFGVLSHIERRENRREVLKALWKMSDNLIVTVPNRFGSHKRRFKTHEEYRAADAAKGAAVEEGDILYRAGEGKNRPLAYYHLYSQEELLNDLRFATSVEGNGHHWPAMHIGAANFKREKDITRMGADKEGWEVRYKDAHEARHTPLEKTIKNPDYFIAEVAQNGIIPGYDVNSLAGGRTR